MNRWTWIDGVTWACQPTEDAAFWAWVNTHDQVTVDYIKQFGDRPSPTDVKAFKLWQFNYKVFAVGRYREATDIKVFWRSPVGWFLNTSYQINSRILDFLRFPYRKVRSWLWRFSWLRRCVLVDMGHAKSIMETRAERFEQWGRGE